MKVTPFVIEKFAKFIMGGVPFESMRRIVAAWEDKDLSGEQKRQRAIDEFVTLGYALGSWLVNLGLELAVAWLKSQSK